MSGWPSDAEVIAETKPQWCLFWADSVKVSQFDIWLPYIRRSRYRYAIAASGDGIPASVEDRIADLPNVVALHEFEAAKAALRANQAFRGFLYISTKVDNFRVVDSFRGSLHVWLGHGESGKSANAFRSASIYDAVFMADYHGVRRFPRAVRRWVGEGACAIGVPIVEGAVADPWTAPRPVRTVLYAPTWEGYRETADYSSIPEFVPRLIEAMPALREQGVRVVVRPHPGTGGRRPDYKALMEDLLAAGAEKGQGKTKDFAAADVMVGDVSGVVGEFLFTQKPTIMPTSARLLAIKDDAALAKEYPWVYRWPTDGLDVAAALAGLAERDPLRRTRAREAGRMFRHHDSLEAAARTFDLALSSVRFRKTRIPPRLVFEAKRRLGFLRLLRRR
jgi:hypothetical protein